MKNWENIIKMRWSELYSYILPVIVEKVKFLNFADIRTNYEQNPFVGPSNANARDLFEIDRIILETLPQTFEFLDFSPLSPIGASSTLTKVNQKTLLSTIKNLEVLGDITILFALESAKRKRLSKKLVNLATSGRMVRLQKFAPVSNLTQHFRGFAISNTQELTSPSQSTFDLLALHITTWLEILNALTQSGKYCLKNIKVFISNINIMEKIIEQLEIEREAFSKSIRTENKLTFDKLAINLPSHLCTEGFNSVKLSSDRVDISEEVRLLQAFNPKLYKIIETFPGVLFQYHLDRSAGLGYHSGLCFKISAENRSGERFSLIDGGMKDWLQKLLNNRKEVFCSSGFGTELLAKLFLI